MRFLISLFIFLFSATVLVNSHSSIDSEFIVSFLDYLSSSERNRILSDLLNDSHEWREIPRNNPSSHYPSDFSVVQILNNSEGERNIHLALNRLTSHSLVKRISPQKKFTRKNLNFNSQQTGTDKIYMGNAEDNRMPCSESHDEFNANLYNDGLWSSHNHFSMWGRSNTKQRFALGRRLLKAIPHTIASATRADVLWSRGYTGEGVKVAIFDTGLNSHPHFRNIAERIDWTQDSNPDDTLGHGTFVAGLIAGQYSDCKGLAPNAQLHIYKVFTGNQVSYTSWFLDAFNYAIQTKVDILNLSIGGPDFLDQPFVDKVLELTSHNIILVSAIGNDGPLYGTLNNPADQMDVIGVGGIDYEDNIADFSSRGMTTWELPQGYGRLKPDIVTYGSYVSGSDLNGGCRVLSGTSVASPVVTGAIALLLSAVGKERVNPASVKQALIKSAERLPKANMFEQGHGKLDILRALHILRFYSPHASLSPTLLDTTDCPYMWPYCSQPLYHRGGIMQINVTILNGMGVNGRFLGRPQWQPFSSENGELLDVSITYSQQIWPWSGWMALKIRVNKDVTQETIVQGEITATITPLTEKQKLWKDTNKNHKQGVLSSTVTFPIKVIVIPTPPRELRILWDQFHNLRYPSGYFPRDNLFPTLQSHSKGPHSDSNNGHHESHGSQYQQQPLDWHADHLHTNYRELYTHLRSRGYYIETLGSPYTCYDANDYGTLLVVDPEDEFFEEEIEKIYNDVTEKSMNLVVLADWYNTQVMKKLNLYDENTQQWWTPLTGGSNIPALNELLSKWDLALSDEVLAGTYTLPEVSIGDKVATPYSFPYLSGSSIARYPSAARLLTVTLHDQVLEMTSGKIEDVKNAPILALLNDKNISTSGRVVVYGDSSCFDGTDFHPECMWLLEKMLDFIRGNDVNELTPPLEPNSNEIHRAHTLPLPTRLQLSELLLHSHGDSLRRGYAIHILYLGRRHPSKPIRSNEPFLAEVLDPSNPGQKLPLPSCPKTIWSKPRPIIKTNEYAFPDIPHRDLQNHYSLEETEVLLFGLIHSTQADKNYKLPIIFPLSVSIFLLFLYWRCCIHSNRRSRNRLTSFRTKSIPIV